MEFFSSTTNIKFMEMRRYTVFIALVTTFVMIWGIFLKGFNFGLDFTGGYEFVVKFEQPRTLDEIEKAFAKFSLEPDRIQFLGSSESALLRFKSSIDAPLGELQSKIKEVFNDANIKSKIESSEYIGAEVGKELVYNGILAVVLAIAATMFYVSIRFEYRLAISAAIALLHDIVVILGIFAFTGWEFDIITLAALLAVLGYSLNDSIVVFDRVRENFRRMHKSNTIQIINASINQTLSRTIMTSFLTLLGVISLLFFGGDALFGFSVTLVIGIIVGTYSSIFIAGALSVLFGLSKTDFLNKEKILDEMP